VANEIVEREKRQQRHGRCRSDSSGRT
jgi:hypothetical protein